MSEKTFVVLDTETNDLHGYIVQIGIISSEGETLINELVKLPNGMCMSRGASAVNGITDENLENAKSLIELENDLVGILRSNEVIGWNCNYDRNCLLRTAKEFGLALLVDEIIQSTWIDAMQPFSKIYGEWNDYHGNYKWQKLTTAARYYDISTNGAHDALSDCRMTLAVWQKMESADGN